MTMRKLTVTLTVAALAFATMAMTASAQTQSQGAASLKALKNANSSHPEGGMQRRHRRTWLWARLGLERRSVRPLLGQGSFLSSFGDRLRAVSSFRAHFASASSLQIQSFHLNQISGNSAVITMTAKAKG